ncbi:Wzz/FepE/Etk N-terminal domain-containing protein [Baekduia soli]|uniref:Wzz/FepE/Etk N-terminal domain-containing protein n=1 Tax=Baekduia soli TaxID=496014 RepID=UPI0016528AE6|nr:Wzz/FepE/Etk N-terminal domain-containing protein [Baekduia soli]
MAESPGVVPRAVSRHKLLILFFVLVFAGAGVAGGIVRKPQYTAQADLTVGQADLATQSLQGYAAAVQVLAGVYSRLVVSATVINQVDRREHLGPVELRNRISASPTPDSSTFRIKTTGPDAQSALRLNRLTVNAAQAYIVKLGNNGQNDAKQAFAKFQAAANTAALKRAEAQRLEDQRAADKNSVTDAELAKLNADAAKFDLIAQTYSQQYQNSSLPSARQYQGASVITRPVAATSDQRSWMQKLGILGAFVGLLVGVAIASALEARARRKAY